MINLKDKSIIILGGTGTLGQELVKQLLTSDAKKIIIFSRRDHDQAVMEEKFGFHPRLRFWIGDIRDLDRLRLAFRGIDYVIHTSSLKRVERSATDPQEYVKTIIDGANNIIQASIECGVKRVVALSTDKAEDPLNLYGACKLVSDKLFVHSNVFSSTKFSVIRYGNVLSSNGSYTQKLKNEDTIKITNKEMTRFWISIEYAAALTIHLLQHMDGEEILVPKIPSSRILDFFRVLSPDAEVESIDERIGEKIHEVMINDESARRTLEFENYFIIYPHFRSDREKTFAGELGTELSVDFRYDSEYNPEFLEDPKELIENPTEWFASRMKNL